MAGPADATEVPAIKTATENAARLGLTGLGLFMAISVHKRPPLAKTQRATGRFIKACPRAAQNVAWRE
jgi:hypothetical protein